MILSWFLNLALLSFVKLLWSFFVLNISNVPEVFWYMVFKYNKNNFKKQNTDPDNVTLASSPSVSLLVSLVRIFCFYV